MKNKKAMRRIIRNLDKYAEMVCGACGFDELVEKAGWQRAKLICMIEDELNENANPQKAGHNQGKNSGASAD